MAKCLGPSDDESCPQNLKGGGEDGRCLNCGDEYYLFSHHPTEYEKCSGPFQDEGCPDGNDAIPRAVDQTIYWESCTSCEQIRNDRIIQGKYANRAPPLPNTTYPESYYNKYGGYDWNNKDA